MGATLDLGNLLVHLRMDATQYMSMAKNVEARMRKMSSTLTRVGRQMTMKITLPLAIMGAAALKTMADLESAFTGVRKTVDATEKEFARLKKGFEDMSLVVPIAITELYGIGEAAGQLGIQTKNILTFSRVMADLGVTTNIAAQDAAMSLARFANITQMSQGDFDRLGATIVDLGNNLATTEAEIVTMSMRMAGVGKVVGLTEHAILALAAAVSSVGIHAEAGGSAMSRVMLDMNTYVKQGARELELLAEVAGVTTKEFAESFKQNAVVAIRLFVAGLDKLNESGVDVAEVLKGFGWQGIRITRVLLALAGASNVLEQSLVIGEKAWEENTALVREAELRYGTFASQIRLLRNRLVLISDEIGNILKPAIVKMIESLGRAVDFWNLMEDSVKRNIFVFAAVAAGIGPVLLTMGLFLKSLIFVSTAVNFLTISFVGLTTAMFGPIGVSLLLIAMAYTLRAAWEQNLEVIKDRMQEWFNAFKTGFDWLSGTLLGDTLIHWAKSFKKTFDFIRNDFGEFITSIAGMWQGSISWFKKMAAGLVDAWEAPTFGQMIDEFKRGFGEAGDAWALSFVEGSDKAKDALEKFKKSVEEGYKTSVIVLGAFGEATIEHLSELMATVKTQFGQDADALIALIRSKILKLKGETPLGLSLIDVTEVEAEVDKLNNALGGINRELEASPLEQWMGRAKDVASRVSEAFASAFERMGDELANFLVEGKADFKDFAKSVLKDLLAIMIRARMVRALTTFLPGLIPAPQIAPQPVYQVRSPVGHAGGIVGQMTNYRTVPASIFAGAPRLHNGLASDEFPTILQRGETVIPKGGGIAPTIVINNNTGQQFKQDGSPKFNGKEWVIGIVTEEIHQYGPLRHTIQGIGQNG